MWHLTMERDWSIGRNPANKGFVREGGLKGSTKLIHSSDPDYVALSHHHPRRGTRKTDWCVHKWEEDSGMGLSHQQWYRQCLKCGRTESIGKV